MLTGGWLAAAMLGVLATAVGLAWHGARLWAWSVLGALALGIATGPAPGIAGLAAWAAFVTVAVILNVPGLRRRLLVAPVLAAYRRILPPMSDTEREAIEAGTVWWDGELFGGKPDWRRLLEAPQPRLSERERAFLDGPVETLCAMLDDWAITHELQDLPEAVWDYLKAERFFGMIIPREYGGLGFSAIAHSEVVMKIATRSGSAAVTVMVPNSLGPAELLLHYGTQAQREHFLPRLARGEEVPCFALTGPEAGSDASAMPDTGVVCRDAFRGEPEVLGIRLNWDKRYITLGPVATLLGLAFKLRDPDGLLDGPVERGITVALIPTDLPGITIGNRHRILNQAFQNGPNQGHDVFIPLDWIIGGPGMAGKGWRMLMESLAAGRAISLPALAVGSGKLASRTTGAYAAIRRQFRTPVGQFEGVQEALARIAGNTYLMDAVRVMTAGAVDLGEKPAVLSAIAKYHLTERMRLVLNDAMDVHGGRAICMGPRNYLARGYQGVPIAITVEGANILTRSLIIFGQGAVRCHPFVLREMRAAQCADPEQALREMDGAMRGHVAFSVGNAVRALLLGLSGGRLAGAPARDPTLAWYYRQVTRMSTALALSADLSMLLLGGRLKRLERLSARLGDVLSHLYLASATLKRFEDEGRQQSDRPLLHWACRDSLHRTQNALDELYRNLPGRWAGWLLRLLVFPLGRPYTPPNDANDRRVARLLLRPGAVRDRLTGGIYLGGPDDPTGRVEQALVLAIAAEPAARKLQRAIRAGTVPGASPEAELAAALEAGVIDEHEMQALRAAEAARREAIQVDDFPAESFGAPAREVHPAPATRAVHGMP